MLNFELVKPQSERLQGIVDYFIIIQSNNQDLDRYVTFPNNNICLSIYRDNNVVWDRAKNQCYIKAAGKFGTSKIYAWHQQPFQVLIDGPLDQVCVVFNIMGLSQLTNMPLNKISIQEDPLKEIFGNDVSPFLQRLFDLKDAQSRVLFLESFLCTFAQERTLGIARAFVENVRAFQNIEGQRIHSFCTSFKMSESTLYRNCMKSIGESPKEIIRKIRFRRLLSRLQMNHNAQNLMDDLQYYDQSHMIHEVKRYTGLSPKKLISRMRTASDMVYLPA